ncbi:hypothetical protein [Psychrobacter alimentarius]
MSHKSSMMTQYQSILSGCVGLTLAMSSKPLLRDTREPEAVSTDVGNKHDTF